MMFKFQYKTNREAITKMLSSKYLKEYAFLCMYVTYTQKNVLLNQQKFGWPNKVFRLNMGQWKFLLIQQNFG